MAYAAATELDVSNLLSYQGPPVGTALLTVRLSLGMLHTPLFALQPLSAIRQPPLATHLPPSVTLQPPSATSNRRRPPTNRRRLPFNRRRLPSNR